MHTIQDSRFSGPRRLLALSLVCITAACGGGGGGSSGSFDSSAQLVEIRFPDPNQINPGPRTLPPAAAPLDQQVEFEFSARPNPDEVGTSTLPIVGSNGFPVRGRYEVLGKRVLFTPSLPTAEINGAAVPTVDGLQPGSSYSIRVSPGSWSFIASVSGALQLRSPDPIDPLGALIGFRTTKDPADYYQGLPARRPRLVDVEPVDASIGVSPQLYNDPDGRFPPRGPFRLTFDGPLYPGRVELAGFRLIDLEDPLFPAGLRLGTDISVVVNERTRCVVEVQASGILPLGHLLCLEYPIELRGLTEPPMTVTDHVIASTFTTQSDPAASIRDRLVEDFDTGSSVGTEKDRGIGTAEAEWDQRNSNVLLAASSFSGDGSLGRFTPPPPVGGGTRIVTFDTNNQLFPLFDGSTPDAPPGHLVSGGEFHFTDIDIPAGVRVQVQGSNPLKLTATGSVRIAGSIALDGVDGTNDNTFDSAVASIPGGPAGSGGGRGGVSHPIIFWPPGQAGLTTMVSPPRGGTGRGPGDQVTIGGQGGESGIRDKKKYGLFTEISCQEGGNSNDNGDFGAGGGGGTFMTSGVPGRIGKGNVRPDGQGGWTLITKKDGGPTWVDLNPGNPGQSPFNDIGTGNDYIGGNGELQDLIGGQGGGGGGSRTEAYYCGKWCLLDEDTSNDKLCKGGEFPRGNFADSVGDARGGGGGGGGGGLQIDALGSIDVESTATLSARGGDGGGGEVLGGSKYGGPGGGGSGGAIILHSAAGITVRAGANIDVSPGNARQGPGDGGEGLVQLQVPAGQVANVEDPNDISPPTAWLDPTNQKIGAQFTPMSGAVSPWYDHGRMTQRAPAGSNPTFAFGGLDSQGFVPTDGAGNVVNPGGLDIRCDYLGQEDPLQPGQYLPGQGPRANFIPPNASVRVEFQGAPPALPGSKEIDTRKVTPWSPSPSIADGLQFIRYRVTFNLIADGTPYGPGLPRPAVQSVEIHSDF